MHYSYEHAIKAAIDDFEQFFDKESKFKVVFEIKEGVFFARIFGSTLQFSKYLASETIYSLDDLAFCLIILGHELAHYVNKHNSYNDQSKKDSVAIESWADFFGARIMLTLISKGSATQKLIENIVAVPFARPLTKSESQDLLLGSIGRALERSYNSLYKGADVSPKYPRSSVRVFTFVAGTISFFYRLFGEVKEDWTLFIFKKLLFNTNLSKISYDPALNVDDAFFELIQNIHVQIENGEKFISPGLRTEFQNLIGTGYSKENKDRLRKKAFFQEEFKKWKMPIEI